MKNSITKYVLLIIGFLFLVIVYLSVVGLETDRFNKQIKDRVLLIDDKLDFKLKKLKLTLDPLNLKIEAKTIGTKIIYKKKILELEYIKSQISLNSLIKNKFVSSNLQISTRSILLKDAVRFARAISKKPELFFIEKMIKKGHIIADIEINFDENGNIKNDYQINGLLRDGAIGFSKKYDFADINFILNVKKNIFNFRDINFKTNEINFFSKTLKVEKNNKDFLFEGLIENKNSTLNKRLINLTKLKIENINFGSKNKFSFKINDKFKLKNLAVDSEIYIDELKYKKPKLLNAYFPKVEELISFKDHKINSSYKKDNFIAKGFGKIQLQKKFDKIEYSITNKNKNLNLASNILLSELSIKNQEFLNFFLPNVKKNINLKDHKLKIDFSKNNLLVKGSGKIQLEKEFDYIDYSISKIRGKIDFDSKIDLNKTLLKIDYLNYLKDKKINTKLIVVGNYEKNIGINLNKVSILEKNNKIILNNLLLDKENKIIEVDKIDLDYFDTENKKNKFILQKKQKNNYELRGQIFNANSLISNLLKNKDNKESKILKNDISLSLNLTDVYIDEKTIVKDLKGKLNLIDNRVVQANISAFFDKSKYLTFSINTDNGEKITTLFSSKAKPLVKRYQFIKGFEEGYLDFYSSKKNKTSNSTLVIHDFKLQELPTLTKLLTLASLQGIADILSGEGIRFDEFEMNFDNKDNIMTIKEIYAIGPAISVLMNGYIDEDKLISLRGTLVPATTINKTISSIPFLGKILVGDKTGEGVFGVSFKIKGPPNDLETTVNPIKTLTPRFITRIIENIKKN